MRWGQIKAAFGYPGLTVAKFMSRRVNSDLWCCKLQLETMNRGEFCQALKEVAHIPGRVTDSFPSIKGGPRLNLIKENQTVGG